MHHAQEFACGRLTDNTCFSVQYCLLFLRLLDIQRHLHWRHAWCFEYCVNLFQTQLAGLREDKVRRCYA
ncbi:hypothetical protein M3J09_011761 [Ascochyta lentis]